MTRLQEFLQARAAETYPEPESDGHSHITVKMVQNVCARIPLDSLVLDLGCGQGVALKQFAAHPNVKTAVGTTLHRDDMEVLLRNGFRVWFYDMHDMPGDWTALYNMVWARHVLEHSVAPLFVLRELHRVLKAGGWLYVEVPAPDTACNHEANQNHYSVLGDRAWQCLLDRAGFKIVEMVQWHLNTMAGSDIYFGYVCHKI